MSDQDDTLLDEDLGDEEYDLGNDEEEALLADDYEIDRQNSYKGEEETDDVLDLGVTDVLDDLDAGDENLEYMNDSDRHIPGHCYNDERIGNHGNYYDQEDNGNYNEENLHQRYEENVGLLGEQGGQIGINRGDLREKLQKSISREIVVGNGQGMEDDDCEEARERRNRFQNERIMIPQKMNNEIPDSLESVVTIEQPRMPFRGRGRGRGIRGIRGARFGAQNIGNYNPRYAARIPTFEDQKPQFRPPLLENRPPIFLNGPSNMMNTQMMYHPENQHMPVFQQFPQGVPPRPRSHFNEPRPPFISNQFPVPPQNRMEFGPRGPMQGGPRFNGPIVPQFMPNQPHFQRPPHEPEIPGRQMGNHGPMMQPPGGQVLMGNMPPGSQGPPMHPSHQGHPGIPGQRQESHPQGFRPPGPNIIPQMQHGGGGPPPGQQQGFENRPPFQDGGYEPRNMYEARQFNNRPPVSQFNPPVAQVAQHHPPGPPVPVTPGHKILINPHFRGNVQPPADGRPSWDGSQHPPHQPQAPNEQFSQQSSQYQGQAAYNPPSVPQNPPDYQKNFTQNSKNDDPYAYFSDVWQENKTAKPRASTPPKTYPAENHYSRESGYRDHEKYRSDSRDSYQDVKEPRYRDRSPPPRLRDPPPRSRLPPVNSSYHNDSYEQRSRPTNSSNRPPLRTPQKRTPEPHDRVNREISPKRSKNNRNIHEYRTKTLSTEAGNYKKEEDVDPEMREYRKKMEEQKRLREKILQEKENRRKQAAMDKQVDEKGSDLQQENKPSAPGMNKESLESQGHLTNRTRIRTGSGKTQEVEKPAGVRITRTMPTDKNSTENQNSKEHSSMNSENQIRTVQQSARRVVIQKQMANTRIGTSIQKVVSNIQKSASSLPQNSGQKLAEPSNALKKLSLGVQKKTVSARTVIGERPATVRKVMIGGDSPSGAVKKVIGVQSNRVVLPKQVQIKKVPDIKSNIVVVENLAASTTEAQIRRMCQGIGTLVSITMKEGTATIVFKTCSAAMVFHKKYQRKMIDLSMINVRLIPQSQNKITAS